MLFALYINVFIYLFGYHNDNLIKYIQINQHKSKRNGKKFKKDFKLYYVLAIEANRI